MHNAINRLYENSQRELKDIKKAFSNKEICISPEMVREATIRLRRLTNQFEDHVNIEEADVHMDIEVLRDELEEVMEAIRINHEDEDNFSDLRWARDTRDKLDGLTLEFSKTASHMGKKK